MAIVSSTHTLESHAQADGSVFVTEDHIDNIGQHIFVTYRAAAGTDYVAIRTMRAAQIGARQQTDEIVAVLAADVDPAPLVYATKSKLAIAFRELFRRSRKQETARMARWILDRIDSGFVTEAQIQSVFGLTAGQWTTLKAKLTDLRAAHVAANNAQGE